ncbi:MAG: hypothetical protein HYX74_01690 [Acidobacteria bacterium]|nr:hypothetical protein [Acidobacteriota bacterium]
MHHTDMTMMKEKPGKSPAVSFLLVILISLLGPLHAADIELEVADGARVDVVLNLLPRVRAWEKVGADLYEGNGSLAGGGRVGTRWEQVGADLYEGNGYRLALKPETSGKRTALRVSLARVDGGPFVVQEFKATWSLRSSELFAVWTYSLDAGSHRNYRVLASEGFGEVTAANGGIPYVLLAARSGTNLMAAGIQSQDRIVYLTGLPEEDGYQIVMRFAAAGTRRFEEALYLDLTPAGWFDVTRGYARWVDRNLEYEPFPISPAAYFPLYDAWYWLGDATSLNTYSQTLLKARELGFRSYLFDAGWESQTGELAKWLLGALGNYFAPASKLPGFADFLRSAKQTLGMNVILWVAPYAMGRESVHYPAMKDAHTLFRSFREKYRGGEGYPQTLSLDTRYQENVNLCPRNPDTTGYLANLFDRVSETYRPDGYWLDFHDFVPFICEARHRHADPFGAGFNKAQQVIKEAILRHLNQPTVEIRYPVANLNNKRYGNIWQSIDYPEDFDAMRLCNLIMRPFSEGVVMGTDEMYWSPRADTTAVAKFVATTVLSGVPAMGADFQTAPRSHSDIVKAWLGFYSTHQAHLTGGEFRPIGDFVTPDQKIESPEKAFIYLRYNNPIEVPVDRPAEIYIANCTNSNRIAVSLEGLEPGRYRVQVLDIYLRPISGWTASLESKARIETTVPQGGMLQLVREG